MQWIGHVEPYPLEKPIQGKSHLGFTTHALHRMEQRNISKEDVVNALRSPKSRAFAADIPHKGIMWEKSRSKTLKVVYDEDPKCIRVISAFWAERKS